MSLCHKCNATIEVVSDEETEQHEFGEWVRIARIARRQTQSEFAVSVGLSINTIGRIECVGGRISKASIDAITKYLGGVQ